MRTGRSMLRLAGLMGAVAAALASPGGQAGSQTPTAIAVQEVEVSPVGRYVVTFDEAGLAAYRGEVPGLEATAPHAYPRLNHKFDITSSAAQAYSEWLDLRVNAHIERLQGLLGRSLDVHHYYQVSRHGISVELSHEEANRIAELAGVRGVAPVHRFAPLTYRGPAFIGAHPVWDGTAVPAYAAGSRGEGIRVGVIDTGAVTSHPSFSNDPVCGFHEANPKLVARDCTVNDGVHCTGPEPEPDTGHGHGMHVAATVAGNVIGADAVPAPLLPSGWQMSGVAPCASMVSYKTCVTGGCYGDALEAAVQHAIVDQVDVINYSIGLTCGGGDPWRDLPDFLRATTMDIAVVAAAGNTSVQCIPSPEGRVTNLAPWVTTVAASTHDVAVTTQLQVTGPGVPPSALAALGLRPGSSTLPATLTEDWSGARLRIDPDNLTGCTSSGGFAAGHFHDTIAVIRRGDCNFSEKIINAAEAGARMVIVTNNESAAFNMNTAGAPEWIPAFSINDLATGNALIDFIAAHPGDAPVPDRIHQSGFDPWLDARADYRRALVLATPPDVIAEFSLRGPVPAPMQNLAKPDVAAPGVDIYAASDPASSDYQWMSGTSMASPHVAGATALLRAVHPQWSVDEVKSALMTTAVPTGLLEDLETSWGPDTVGSGRIDVAAATRAGLTFQETEERYRAADPDGSGIRIGIEELNVASLRDVKCGEECVLSRTVRNRLPGTGTWEVTFEQPDGYVLQVQPALFTLAPGEHQTITVTATVEDASLPVQFTHGRIWFTEVDGQAADQQLPVTLRGDEISVECVNGNCSLRLDNFTSGYSAVGCGESCAFLWANRFSPPADAFPITLQSVTFLTGSTAYVHVGDRYDVYVYQDDDRDPTDGAVLVGSQKGYEITLPGARLRVVNFDTPVVLEGPGDVIIAMTNPSGSGPRPAAGEVSDFRRRSYTGNYTGQDPDIGSAAVDLKLNTETDVGAVNFVIRGHGTGGNGALISFGEEPGVPSRR